MRSIQDPVETKASMPDGKSFEHPAFGQITVHRIIGSRALYGSDFMHHNYVRVEIHESQLNRSLSRDWHFSRKTIISVDLSEAQWASFVSSFNVGAGVPCTIASRDGKYVPEFPLRDEGQEYKAEANAKLADALAKIDAAIAEVEANTAGISKAKREAMLGPLRRAHQQLASNLSFVAQSFAEHMETRVEKAKVEVNAYVTQTVARAGLDALRAQHDLPQIPERMPDGEDPRLDDAE